MTILASTIAALIDAGLSGDKLKTVTAAIEVNVEHMCELLREQSVTTDAGCATPAAVRMRKMRETRRLLKEQEALNGGVTPANTVTEQPVTSDNINSKKEGFEEESKKEVVVARKRIKYPDEYEKFWADYPTDKLMSKSPTYTFWKTMDPQDRIAAQAALPEFKKEVVKQGISYRCIHAINYLKQRRYDSFSADPDAAPINFNSYYCRPGTPEWDDHWEPFWIKTKGQKPPRDLKGGWTFPSRYPPSQEQAA